ncbi:hypothetical protein M422DRAFT_247868 [Sphaerobolus stellatus SS14]|nr:hypothetical protein M422DRAFT_247868 [Sphaerobolus stellatus SS14]
MATRRKPLPDLPLEIVHTICDELRNPKDLLALGLAHRRFTHVAYDRHLKYMKIEAPVTHYDSWKYVERVPAFRARAKELTLLPVSPFTILVPPIPSIPPVVSSVIPSAAVTVIPSPTLPAGPSATTSASSSSTSIPSSGSAENQDYAQKWKKNRKKIKRRDKFKQQKSKKSPLQIMRFFFSKPSPSFGHYE